MLSQNITFNSDGLVLEGVLHLPAEEWPLPAVLVCHPHPRFGGDMQNDVVLGVCRGLQERGIAALRFNFRGVGASDGSLPDSGQAVSDAIHGIEYLMGLKSTRDSQVGILGYSFGASVAIDVVTEGHSDSLQAVGLIACPGSALNNSWLRDSTIPKLLIAGDLDHVVPVEEFNALSSVMVEPCEVHILRGGDHFLRGHEAEIGLMVGHFFRQWLIQESGV